MTGHIKQACISHTYTCMWLTEWRKPALWFASACVVCGAGSAPSWTAAHRWGCREMYGLSSQLPPGNPSSPRGPSPSLSPWWPAAAGDWAAGEAAGAGDALGHRWGWGMNRGSGPSFAKAHSTASRRGMKEGPAEPGCRPQTHRAGGQK